MLFPIQHKNCRERRGAFLVFKDVLIIANFDHIKSYEGGSWSKAKAVALLERKEQKICCGWLKKHNVSVAGRFGCTHHQAPAGP